MRGKNYRNSGSAGPAEPPQKQQKVGISWLAGWLPANHAEAPEGVNTSECVAGLKYLNVSQNCTVNYNDKNTSEKLKSP